MELIKGNEHRIIIRMRVGEGNVTYDDGSVENVIVNVSNSYAPIVEFENGDMVVMTWDDIAKIATKVRKGEIEHE